VGAVRRAALNVDAVSRIETYVADLDAREEALGKAVSAWWENDQPTVLRTLETCALEAFEAAALDGMGRLQAATPGTAASGVIVFVRGHRDDGANALALFKMAPHAVTHAQFHPDAQPAAAITVEELADVLPEPNELAKAAIMPHPLGEAPLRVVDVTTGGEPAGYWLKFLGAQQPPKQPKLGRMLVDASQAALESAGMSPDSVRAAVAERLEAVAAAGEPVAPRAFVEALAQEAHQAPDEIWEQAQAREKDLATPHALISPVTTQRLKTTIDLGEDIVLSGPATVMRPPRVQTVQDDDGWYVKVRSSARPRPRTK
jgi:hypothetical protein